MPKKHIRDLSGAGDGIAFCSTKNYIFLEKRVTPEQLKRNFSTFREENSRPLRGHKENSRINICDCFLYSFGCAGMDIDELKFVIKADFFSSASDIIASVFFFVILCGFKSSSNL